MAACGEPRAVAGSAVGLGPDRDRGLAHRRRTAHARAGTDPRSRGARMSVAIVTDSAAALPSDLVARHGITVVPMWLTVRGMPEPEGERPLEQLVVETDVTTSAPTPGEFETAIKETRAD